MIVVRMCGGLGNQMFQYATGRAIALANGAELVLDLDWYRRTPATNTPREYELARYPIHARLPSTREQTIARFYSGRVLRRLPLVPRPWHVLRERSFAFDKAALEARDETYLDGYWQSYKYFEEIAEQLRIELTPTPQPSSHDLSVLDRIRGCDSVSVHVRRGDYVMQKAAASVHGVCTLEYYHAAMRAITDSVREPHFFVFSDDIEWTRQNLAFPGPVTFVDHNGPSTAFQDIRLMSSCRHHVIANSSFSWWGAWLSPHQNRTVVAPRLWFADGRATNDLTPAHWIRL